MGKEQDIIQAAQEGNLAKLEVLLTQKPSKVFSSLFKGPNINWADESGYTALHLASLHGHKDVVNLLLHNDASTNTPDNAGSYPLHLAAFNGHDEVAKILMTRGPSRASVNQPNMAGDTALHMAAQYGHRKVVQILLECHADATLRNSKEESPLDLAAQYGRLSTVKVFVLYDASLLTSDAVHKHSPMHLAARNGHHRIVSILLDHGMPLNAACDMGTALHCAALYGKISVAKLLLERGIDIDIEDDNGHKVLDLLCNHPSQTSQEITALIYAQSQMESESDKRKPSASYCGQNFEIVDSHEGDTKTAPFKQRGKVPPNYDFVPPPRLASDSTDNSQDRPYSVLHAPLVENNSIDSSFHDFETASITPLDEWQIARNHGSATFRNSGNLTTIIDEVGGEYCEVDRTYPVNSNVGTDNEVSIYSSPPRSFSSGAENYDNVNLSSPSRYSYQHQEDEQTEYDNVNISNKPESTHVVSAPMPVATDCATQDYYQSPPVRSPSDPAPVYTSIKKKSMKQRRTKKSSRDVEASPQDVYDAPRSFEETPKSYSERSEIISKDVENNNAVGMELYDSPKNITDNILSAKLKTSANIVANDDFEYNSELYDTPPKKSPKEIPQTQAPDVNKNDTQNENTRSQINSENAKTNPPTSAQNKPISANKQDQSGTTPTTKPRTKIKQKRTSVRDVSTGYRMSSLKTDTSLNESYEWNKIDDFLNDLEAFAETPVAAPSEETTISTENLSSWLKSLHLDHYEPMFAANGYDNIKFLNGCLENQDLIEMGILDNDHRKTLIEGCKVLPPSPLMGEGTLGEWLATIDLGDYEQRFLQNGYDDLDRIQVIWDIELVTVLDITALGYRKRIIHSLGRKSVLPVKSNISWSQKFADAGVSNEFKFEAIQPKLTNKQTPAAQTKPKEKAVGTPVDENILVTVKKTNKWIHDPDTLLLSYAAYATQYLGSHPVQHVKGVASTLEACAKMKAISRNVHKMPMIVLSISARGIDYIDGNSKILISQYAINHISFCAQDPGDFRVFAYITRDQYTKKKYCHVFKALSTEVADEVVLTIGQCFEIAYQQHLQQAEFKRNQQKSPTPGKDPPAPPMPYAQKKLLQNELR